jgi:membrane protease YdiL (CAAX protease family)
VTEPAPQTQSGPPRLLQRLPVQLLIMFVALAAIDLACQLLGVRAERHVAPALRDPVRLAAAVLLSAAMITAYRWLVRALERRTADELGTKSAARGLAFGAAAGAALFALVYGILWGLGAVTFNGLGGVTGLGLALAIAVSSAVGEEIVFRGVIFRLFEDRMGTIVALIVSAALFGLLHAGNRGATWVSTAAIVLESGVLLGLAYTATRALWLPIGLHFGWNFTEGGIFGAAVSGREYAGLVSAPLSGSPFLTGGAFGPEASIAALLVSLGASAALAWHVARVGAWRRGAWRSRGA